MTDVEQLERHIKNLSPEDLAKFRAWFADFDSRAWDEQIAADLNTGKLDNLISEARKEYKSGKTKEL